MKKIYTAPEIEITIFLTEDIITASGNDNPTTGGSNDSIVPQDGSTPYLIDWERDIQSLL